MTKSFRTFLIGWARRAEGGVNNLLAVFSMLAVALVVSTELVNSQAIVPVLGSSWAEAQVIARTVIWAMFVVSFVTYCILSKRPLHYIRHHVLELLICVTWIPHYSEGSLQVFTQVISLSRLVPIDVLQLIGTIAHAWRVLRWTGQRFRQHPLIVVGSAAVLVISSAAALLNHVEPQTFPTFWDGVWFSMTTVTTIGFGDLVPKTGAGRMITIGLIVSGISLAGIFLGLMTEFVRKRLLKTDERNEPASLAHLQEELDETRDLVRQLSTKQDETNELLRRVLSQRHDAVPPAQPSSPPVSDEEPTL